MQLFEIIVALLLIAVLLLGLARRLGVPYPSLLALAGAGIAFVPGLPTVSIDPHMALALFIAPALLHAGLESSPRGLWRNAVPLTALAVIAVLLTAAAAMLTGHLMAGMPIAAALALGAIVAPPDAAAASAVLSQSNLPRRSLFVLQGESLLNDATALLLFGAATSLALPEHSLHDDAPGLLLGIPFGVALGWAAAFGYLRLLPRFSGTLGATVVDIAVTLALWLVAERVQASAVLAVVTFALVSARRRPFIEPARDRVHAASVWAAGVFILNVLAFMLMGLQARTLVANLEPSQRWPAIGFTLALFCVVVLVRLGWLMTYRAVAGFLHARFAPRWLPTPVPWRVELLVAWAGMRGLLTVATALALPANFPARDLIVLSAFGVVLGTLVLQGFTIELLVRALRVPEDTSLNEALSTARAALLHDALDTIGAPTDSNRALHAKYASALKVAERGTDPQGATDYDRARLAAVRAQRRHLLSMRSGGAIAEDVFRRLQEELDWAEIDAHPLADMHLDEA
ncbi:MAG: cation:proton antiporter [Janthinobacterium lividum]